MEMIGSPLIKTDLIIQIGASKNFIISKTNWDTNLDIKQI
jgi:hypothetical protein